MKKNQDKSFVLSAYLQAKNIFLSTFYICIYSNKHEMYLCTILDLSSHNIDFMHVSIWWIMNTYLGKKIQFIYLVSRRLATREYLRKYQRGFWLFPHDILIPFSIKNEYGKVKGPNCLFHGRQISVKTIQMKILHIFCRCLNWNIILFVTLSS